MIINFVYAELILVFAIIVMTLLLDIHPPALPSHKKQLFFIAVALIVLLSIFSMLFFMQRFPILYPLLVHLPLIIVLCVVSGKGAAKVIFVLLTTIFICYPPGLVHSVLVEWFGDSAPWILGVDTAACALTIVFICRFMQRDFVYIIESFGVKETLNFCLIPLGYNVLAYLIGQYRISSVLSVLRIILFLSALGVYFLLMNIVRMSRERELLQRNAAFMKTQIEAAKMRLDELKRTQEQAVNHRHDLRHHVSLISGFLECGELEKTKSYLSGLQAEIDAITPVRYCENETANLILSAFSGRAEKQGILLSIQAALPRELNLPDTELCSVLSNGLENALNAAARVTDSSLRKVHLECRVDGKRILLLIENPYEGEPLMENGVPISNCEGHGFGCRSMLAIAEKRKGFCTFKATEGIFTLRVILPMGSG